jgi:hypothetical protein
LYIAFDKTHTTSTCVLFVPLDTRVKICFRLVFSSDDETCNGLYSMCLFGEKSVKVDSDTCKQNEFIYFLSNSLIIWQTSIWLHIQGNSYVPPEIPNLAAQQPRQTQQKGAYQKVDNLSKFLYTRRHGVLAGFTARGQSS